MEPLLIGIAGGTGSGKTTVARRVYESLKGVNVVVIQQDAYYIDLSHLPLDCLLYTSPSPRDRS